MSSVVVAIDGGNSKTEVALADSEGEVIGLVRGPGSSPDKLGTAGAMEVISGLTANLLHSTGHGGTTPSVLAAMLAGLDLPEEVARMRQALQERYATTRIVVDNDAVAPLLAGTGGHPGVAIVCGAGFNAVAQSESGQRHSMLSLGQVSGDWGGGLSLGREVLWYAIRAEDGRGSHTTLCEQVRRHFEVVQVRDLVLALHRGEVPESALAELVPVLFEEDNRADRVAQQLVDRLADEVVVTARAMLRRAGLEDSDAPLVLAGGVLTAGHRRLLESIRTQMAASHPLTELRWLSNPPVSGVLAAALRTCTGTAGSGTAIARMFASRLLQSAFMVS